MDLPSIWHKHSPRLDLRADLAIFSPLVDPWRFPTVRSYVMLTCDFSQPLKIEDRSRATAAELCPCGRPHRVTVFAICEGKWREYWGASNHHETKEKTQPPKPGAPNPNPCPVGWIWEEDWIKNFLAMKFTTRILELLVKNMLSNKLHCQESFDLILFSY